MEIAAKCICPLISLGYLIFIIYMKDYLFGSKHRSSKYDKE